jgi:anti-anti-sigma factor
MAAEFSIHTESVNGVTIICPQGHVDDVVFPDFKDELDKILRGDQIPRIAVDCSKLLYMNSKGLGLLAGTHRKLIVQRGQLVLFAANARIKKSLDLLGLESRLTLCPDRQSALQFLATATGDK